MSTWETYNIDITHSNEDTGAEKEQERGDVTDQFEGDLFRLIQKYQGRAGLKFDARTSENQPIIQY